MPVNIIIRSYLSTFRICGLEEICVRMFEMLTWNCFSSFSSLHAVKITIPLICILTYGLYDFLSIILRHSLGHGFNISIWISFVTHTVFSFIFLLAVWKTYFLWVFCEDL
jgi:hypothetical protein